LSTITFLGTPSAWKPLTYDRLMAQPERNHRCIDAGLQQLHGGRMPQRMRRYMLRSQRWAALTGGGDVLRQQILDPIVTQSATTAIGEGDLPFPEREFLQPGLQNGRCLFGERNAAFLAPLAQHMDMGTGAKMGILAGQRGQLRRAQAGLHRQEQPGVVAAARPSALVGGDEDRVDFRPRQVMHLLMSAALGGNREHALDLLGVLGQLEGGITEEGTDGGEPQVAAARPDPPLRLQVLEKSADQRRIKRFPGELGRLFAETGFCKLEQ
jgi:hypothetical protein